MGLVDQVWVARPAGCGRPRKQLDHLTGDKGTPAVPTDRRCARPPHPHTIPEQDDQKANRARKDTRGGRPPRLDRQRCKQRNQVERPMNRRKQFHAVATRFDKLGCRYRATVAIADIFSWLRARADQPHGDPGCKP